jgi:hypothetical protein
LKKILNVVLQFHKLFGLIRIRNKLLTKTLSYINIFVKINFSIKLFHIFPWKLHWVIKSFLIFSKLKDLRLFDNIVLYVENDGSMSTIVEAV